MGFADYFLIVWDFIRFAKTNGIGVGPGRGSAAGPPSSPTVLEIHRHRPDQVSTPCSSESSLPGPQSMPDIDIDFAVAGRDRAMERYVSEKVNGRDRAAEIITFGTMTARAAVRVRGARRRDPDGTVDRIAKLIPKGVTRSTSTSA